MKKVLMIAAVACMATFAQALTINWTTTTAIPFVANDAEYTLVYSSTSEELTDVYANITDYTKLDGVAFASMTEVSGTLSTTTEGLPESLSTYYFFCNDGANVYGATFDATLADWKGNIVGGDTFGASPVPFTATLNFEQVAVVPEPTALALLALGVAGVALRRRRRA